MTTTPTTPVATTESGSGSNYLMIGGMVILIIILIGLGRWLFSSNDQNQSTETQKAKIAQTVQTAEIVCIDDYIDAKGHAQIVIPQNGITIKITSVGSFNTTEPVTIIVDGIPYDYTGHSFSGDSPPYNINFMTVEPKNEKTVFSFDKTI